MDIKIVICCVILCLIPPASADDALRTAKHIESNTFVTLTVSNFGDRPAQAELSDNIPGETTKPLNVAPTDLVLFMILSYITIAGVFLTGALIAYSAAEVLR